MATTDSNQNCVTIIRHSFLFLALSLAALISILLSFRPLFPPSIHPKPRPPSSTSPVNFRIHYLLQQSFIIHPLHTTEHLKTFKGGSHFNHYSTAQPSLMMCLYVLAISSNLEKFASTQTTTNHQSIQDTICIIASLLDASISSITLDEKITSSHQATEGTTLFNNAPCHRRKLQHWKFCHFPPSNTSFSLLKKMRGGGSVSSTTGISTQQRTLLFISQKKPSPLSEMNARLSL